MLTRRSLLTTIAMAPAATIAARLPDLAPPVEPIELTPDPLFYLDVEGRTMAVDWASGSSCRGVWYIAQRLADGELLEWTMVDDPWAHDPLDLSWAKVDHPSPFRPETGDPTLP